MMKFEDVSLPGDGLALADAPPLDQSSIASPNIIKSSVEDILSATSGGASVLTAGERLIFFLCEKSGIVLWCTGGSGGP